MATRSVDVAIIGAGTAGLAAYKAASQQTDRVLLIEQGPHGTTCARTGCMPSKLLIAAADSCHEAQQASRFGIRTGRVEADGSAVMQRLQRLRGRFVGSVLNYVNKISKDRRLSGQARFTAPHTLDVDGRRIEARAIILATGSRPSVPAMFRDAGDRLLTTDSLFELNDLPDSVAVVGGGVIGLELGQALHRLQVRSRIFEMGPSLGPATDPRVAEETRRIFCEELDVELQARVERVERNDRGIVLYYRDGEGQERQWSAQRLLLCVGREPNLDALDLEAAELELDDRGIPVFDPTTQRCGDSPVFIAGDLNGHRPVLHEAANQGRIAGANAGRYPDVRVHPPQPAFTIAFTSPQIASIGQAFDQLDPDDFAAGSVDFEDQGRSRVLGRNRGIGRLYGARDTGRLLGAEMIGPDIEHLAHLLAWSLVSELTVDDMISRPFYHPVIEEGLRTALKYLREDLQMGPPVDPECIDCGPGV